MDNFSQTVGEFCEDNTSENEERKRLMKYEKQRKIGNNTTGEFRCLPTPNPHQRDLILSFSHAFLLKRAPFILEK